jgi:hypothetical protein
MGSGSIIDAIADPALFARWFRDPATWQAWFAFLAVLFGLPLTPDQLAIWQQCTGRTAPPSGPFYEAWLICGRRAGKSFILALIAVFLACCRDWQANLVPGETGRIVIIAADRRQARVIFGYVLGFLENVPMLSGMIVRQTADTIDLVNNISIEIQAASFRTIRGYSLVGALADEAAFWQSDETGANPATEIIRSIRPALASIPGSMLLVASSPYAERGALWSAHRKHHGRDNSPVLTWQAPTRTMNPSIPQSVIDEAMESDPASASAEYMAQFRADISTFIERALIERCIDRGVVSRQPVPGLTYACFADAASGVGGVDGDRFAMAIGHREHETVVIDYTREWRPPFDASSVVAELASVCRNYNNISEVTSDRYSIGFMVSELQRNRLTHRPSDLDKSRLYLHALPNLTSNRVRFPDVPAIIDQFSLLERRPGSNGHDRVDARGGRHEDLANVIAGCVWLLSGPQSSAENWIEYLRRVNEAAGLSFSRAGVDMDPFRPSGPAFGWNMNTEPLIHVVVPEPIARENRMRGLRRIGDQTIAEMTRGEAAGWLRNSVWRSLNEALAKELLGETA